MTHVGQEHAFCPSRRFGLGFCIGQVSISLLNLRQHLIESVEQHTNFVFAALLDSGGVILLFRDPPGRLPSSIIGLEIRRWSCPDSTEAKRMDVRSTKETMRAYRFKREYILRMSLRRKIAPIFSPSRKISWKSSR